ncbi:MAG: hypothetical protein U5M53_13775 [Rhodoferax sp.]|nr:hypothetical protein [Rhodoferax sp.]
MAESTRIGPGSCPVCASPKAHYTLSRKGLVCVTCNACNFQGFARSERSDELLRSKIRTEAVPPLVSEPTKTAAAAAALVETPPAAVTEKTDPPARRSFLSW